MSSHKEKLTAINSKLVLLCYLLTNKFANNPNYKEDEAVMRYETVTLFSKIKSETDNLVSLTTEVAHFLEYAESSHAVLQEETASKLYQKIHDQSECLRSLLQNITAASEQYESTFCLAAGVICEEFFKIQQMIGIPSTEVDDLSPKAAETLPLPIRPIPIRLPIKPLFLNENLNENKPDDCYTQQRALLFFNGISLGNT